jgi:hypothetical protein
VAGDVLKEDPLKAVSEFADDPCDIWPQMPLVSLSLALSGIAERLARVSGKEGVKASSEGLGIEGGKVIPDGGRGEVSGALGGDEPASGVFFPFDKASRVKSGLGQHEAHIEAAAA